MPKTRLFVRGYGFLGQMGIKNTYHIPQWSPIETFNNKKIKTLSSNLGQTFILCENSEIYQFGWPSESSNISRTYKTLNPPDPLKYFLLKTPRIGKYFFLDQHILPKKLEINDLSIKDIKSGNGVLYILLENGQVLGMGDSSRGKLGKRINERDFESFGKIEIIEEDNFVEEISSGFQHFLMLDSRGDILGCGASNYCQLPTRDRNLKQVFQVCKFNEIFKFCKISAGFFHSLFLEQNCRQVFGVGQNFKMQCGIGLEKAEILEVPQKVFDLEYFGGDEDEIILDLKSGSSHNFYITNKRLIFSGNSTREQFPLELGNKWESGGIFAEEVLFEKFNLEFSDITSIEPNFDRTGICFKDGSGMLFGGIEIDSEKSENKELEFFKDIEGYKIKKIIPGLQWEFAICEKD